MASTYHFSSLPVPAGKSAAAHYDYLAREGKYSVEYYGQDDLRVEQSGNMPAWAAKPEDFWNAADRFGKVNGRSYREINVALQNELSFEDNLQLVREFLKESGIEDQHAYYYAIHSRTSIDGTQENIHAHIMFNEKVVEHDRPLDRYNYFRNYAVNREGQPTSGYRTSKRHSSREGILSDRYLWENIVNRKFRERNMDERVSAKSLKEQRAELLAQGRHEEAALLNRTPAPHMGNLLKQKGNPEKLREYIRQFQQEAAEKEIEEKLTTEPEKKSEEQQQPPESINVGLYNEEENKKEKKRKAKRMTSREELENIEDRNEKLLAVYAHDYVIRQLARRIQKKRQDTLEKAIEKQADTLANTYMEVTVKDIIHALKQRQEELQPMINNLRIRYKETKGSKVPEEHIYSAALNHATDGEYDRLRKRNTALDKRMELIHEEAKKRFQEYYSHNGKYYNEHPEEHTRLFMPLNDWLQKEESPILREQRTIEQRLDEIKAMPKTDKAAYEEAVASVQKDNTKADAEIKKINKEYGKITTEKKRIDTLYAELSKLDNDRVLFDGKIGRILTKNDKVNGTEPLKTLERFVHDGNEYYITGEHNGGKQGGYCTAVRLHDDVTAGSVPTYNIYYYFDGSFKDVSPTEEKTRLYAGRASSKEDAFKTTTDTKLQRSPAIREANDFRATATAALAVKAATGLIGNSSKKETSNKHTKLRFRKDNGKMTEAERILRQYFSDEADITDDLPDRKPKTDAMKEISNAIAAFRRTKNASSEKSMVPERADPAKTTKAPAGNKPRRS